MCSIVFIPCTSRAPALKLRQLTASISKKDLSMADILEAGEKMENKDETSSTNENEVNGLNTSLSKKNITDILSESKDSLDDADDSSDDDDDCETFYIASRRVTDKVEKERDDLKIELEKGEQERNEMKIELLHFKTENIELKESLETLKLELFECQKTALEDSITEHQEVLEALKEMPEKYRKKTLKKMAKVNTVSVETDKTSAAENVEKDLDIFESETAKKEIKMLKRGYKNNVVGNVENTKQTTKRNREYNTSEKLENETAETESDVFETNTKKNTKTLKIGHMQSITKQEEDVKYETKTDETEVKTPRRSRKSSVLNPSESPERNMLKQVHFNLPTPSTLSKRRRCSKFGEDCLGCAWPDCGECVHCLDKPSRGGLNRLKQRCVRRSCRVSESNTGTDESNTAESSETTKTEIKMLKRGQRSNVIGKGKDPKESSRRDRELNTSENENVETVSKVFETDTNYEVKTMRRGRKSSVRKI